MTPTDPTYLAAWRDYNVRKLAFLLAAAGAPLPLLFIGPVTSLLSVSEEAVKYGSIGVWLLAFAVLSARYIRFRCPRCGRIFGMKFPYRDAFAKRCLHCGLPRGALHA